MAQSDIDKVQTWLEQQGFSVDSVARSKNMVRFSGTVGQVERAFQTEMHYYGSSVEKHFAPSMQLSVPLAIAPTINAVRNLSDFRPKPMYIKPRTAFTSGRTGNVFFAPGDIVTTYDINYNALGVDGTGQSIAIVGQSAIDPTDIANFQSAAGLPNNPPTLVLVPLSGASTVFSNDEGESDLDIQWSGAIAKGATIDFVYTGNNSNFNVFDSITFAIDSKIAPIISISYGVCETVLQQPGNNSFLTSMESTFQQAAAQGQTILAASGDQGSTACSGDTGNNLTTAQQQALAVNYPASSSYVTAVGGTSITAADGVDPVSGNQGANFSTYWGSNGTPSTTTPDLVNSAKKYIPEVVWNDDALSGTASAANGGSLSATGGGKSALFAQPSYQTSYFTTTGETNPDSAHRLVPDVALYSSPDLPGYLYCTSDTSNWQSGQQASCNSGFRDSTSKALTVAGGTSFATPIFAGMIALINQKQEWTAGQGQANINLYKLASNSTTYASAFHDVTSGDNKCTATGSGLCASNGSTLGFAAGPGYDMVTGLGSVDLASLAGVWPTNPSALIGTKTNVTAATTTPDAGTNDVVTITVTSVTGNSIPSGNVSLSIDGGGTGGSMASVTLTSNGTATYPANFATGGPHTIVAQYAGDSTHAASTGTIVLNVVGKGTFTMLFNPTTLTVKQGTQGTQTLTITPAGGYTGTVNLTYTTSNNTALQNLCVLAGSGITGSGSMAVGTSATMGQIIIDTKASDCVTAALSQGPGRNLRLIPRASGSVRPSTNAPKKSKSLPIGMAFAGLLLAGSLGRSSRKLRQMACVVALASLGLALSACGGTSSNTPTVSNPAKGTYTITFSGQDSVTSTINAQQSFTLVIN
jgi:subtilase family serine protease